MVPQFVPLPSPARSAEAQRAAATAGRAASAADAALFGARDGERVNVWCTSGGGAPIRFPGDGAAGAECLAAAAAGVGAAAPAGGGQLLPPAAFVTSFDPDASGLPFAISRLLPDAAPFLRVRLLGLRMLRAGEELRPQAVGGGASAGDGAGDDVNSELSRLLVFPPMAGGHGGGALRVVRAEAVPPAPLRPYTPLEDGEEEVLLGMLAAGAEAAPPQSEAAAGERAAAAADTLTATRAAHDAALVAAAEAEAAGVPWSRKEAALELSEAAEGALRWAVVPPGCAYEISRAWPRRRHCCCCCCCAAATAAAPAAPPSPPLPPLLRRLSDALSAPSSLDRRRGARRRRGAGVRVRRPRRRELPSGFPPNGRNEGRRGRSRGARASRLAAAAD